MQTFNEFLKHRDPILYEEILNEVSWKDVKNGAREIKKNWKPYLGLMAGGLGGMAFTTGIGTDTTGIGTDKQNQIQTSSINMQQPDKKTNPVENQYKPEEILLKKQVIPKDLIRSGQLNPEKWDKDFQNLEAPDPYDDEGYATHKFDMFKPATMFIVKKDAMNRVAPNSGAYALKGNIVIPDNEFEVLPTANTDGKLTQLGTQIVSHELRHVTQRRPYKAVYKSMSGDITDENSEKGKGYMLDPLETGVRLAALKNLLSHENIENIVIKLLKNRVEPDVLETYKKTVSEMINVIPNNDKAWLEVLTNPEAYKKYFKDQNMNVHIEKTIKIIKVGLKSQSVDVDSLLNFIEKLPNNEKKSYVDNLMQNVNKVVKGDTGLRDRLQQRLAGIRGGDFG